MPQLVARPSVPPAVAPKAGPFDLRFSAYTSGDLRVGDPEWVSPVSQTASIGRAVAPGEYRSVGKIIIYRAGYFPMNLWTQTGGDPIEPINGREASLFTLPSNITPTVAADSLLFWRYADDSVGVLASFRKRLTRAEMVRVASAFRLTAPRPVRLPFSVSFVPPGLRLVAVEVSRAKTATALLMPEATDGYEFTALYEQAKFVSEWSEPGPGSKEPVDSSVPRAAPGNAPAPTGSIVIGVQLSFVPGTGPTPKCEPFPRQTSVTACRIAPDDTSYVVTLGGGDVPLDYTKRVGREVQVVGRGIPAMRPAENPETWPTVREAFPTSAQVMRD
ncbi:hypothetical protein [Paractinoplanes hotanensis]|uniref:Uncharacterized protein n=1 Tax=Paractinoplanes hotanensis TaxID=2906497 RepID=A0ABT0XZU2_9ACTN|nr:hypothetical protein [Actinoplanes hotanensis]MCM4079301.1 hypothetical protein [Actinoplanes hotanensis]